MDYKSLFLLYIPNSEEGKTLSLTLRCGMSARTMYF